MLLTLWATCYSPVKEYFVRQILPRRQLTMVRSTAIPPSSLFTHHLSCIPAGPHYTVPDIPSEMSTYIGRDAMENQPRKKTRKTAGTLISATTTKATY